MLGLSMGMRYPLDDFASLAYTIDETTLEFTLEAQFAKTGLAYYAGFAGRIIGGNNKTNNAAYSDAMTEILQKDEEDLSNSEAFIRQKYSTGGFAYDFGLGLKHKFSSNKFLQLNGYYIASKIVKDNIKTLKPFTQDKEYVKIDIVYQNLSFTIGLGHMF